MTSTYYNYNSVDAVNKYTLLQLTISNTDGLSAFIPSSIADRFWGFSNTMIGFSPSLVVDQNLLDFYIIFREGFLGPSNKQVMNSYNLINALSFT
jgi:hypothetical protein